MFDCHHLPTYLISRTLEHEGAAASLFACGAVGAVRCDVHALFFFCLVYGAALVLRRRMEAWGTAIL